MNAKNKKQPTHNNNREKGPLADQLQRYHPPKWRGQSYSTLPTNKVEETLDAK